MRYYLSTAFCLSILAMAPSLFGQKNYLPGTVTNINGITQTGWVDYKNWHKNPRSILFKSENGQEAQLSYIDVASFEVMRPDKELERYKRAIVQVDISPTKTDELDDNPLPIFKTDTILLRVLELVWDLVTWLKTALFCQFSTFFQSSSPTILLQKAKKLTKNCSFLTQAPNPKQALSGR